MTTSGPDISTFEFKPVLDLSGATASMKIVNQSVGLNLPGVKYVFSVYTPDALPMHLGDFTFVSPDKTGIWAEFIITETIPLINGAINFGSLGYKVVGAVKDSANNIFVHPDVFVVAGSLFGNNGTNNFGLADLYYEVKCNEALLFVQDETNYNYLGQTGVVESKTLKIVDPEGILRTFQGGNTTQIPLTLNGNGYQLIFEAVVLYTFSNNTQIRVKYKFREFFPVLCDANLCQVSSILRTYESEKSCAAQEMEDHIKILSRALRAVIGVIQPACGVNVSEALDEIYKISGTECTAPIEVSGLIAREATTDDGGETPPDGTFGIEEYNL